MVSLSMIGLPSTTRVGVTSFLRRIEGKYAASILFRTLLFYMVVVKILHCVFYGQIRLVTPSNARSVQYLR
jgi:hypothetical protein